jgi:hypothetical protein
MRKNIIIASIIIIVIVLGVAAYFVLRGASSPNGTPVGNQGTGGNLPPVSTSSASFPSGTTFQIGTSQGSVTVNNFYKTEDYITQDQETVVLVENDNYTIVYNRDDSGFIIAILVDAPGVRSAAESAFLSQLGISQSDACKLTVNERILDTSSPDDGELMGLSFCGNGAFQSQ